MHFDPQVAIGSALALLVPIVGYLLSRSISTVDTKLSELSGAIRGITASVAEVRETNVELRVRVARMEADVKLADQLYRDMAGFLSSQGFRKRDG